MIPSRGFNCFYKYFQSWLCLTLSWTLTYLRQQVLPVIFMPITEASCDISQQYVAFQKILVLYRLLSHCARMATSFCHFSIQDNLYYLLFLVFKFHSSRMATISSRSLVCPGINPSLRFLVNLKLETQYMPDIRPITETK